MAEFNVVTSSAPLDDPDPDPETLGAQNLRTRRWKIRYNRFK